MMFWEDYDCQSYQDFRESLQHYKTLHDELAEMNYQLQLITLFSEEYLEIVFDTLITERSHLLKVKEQRLARIITLFFRHHRVPCPVTLFFNAVIEDVRNLKETLVSSRLNLENTRIFVDEIYSASAAYLASNNRHGGQEKVIKALIKDLRFHSHY